MSYVIQNQINVRFDKMEFAGIINKVYLQFTEFKSFFVFFTDLKLNEVIIVV